MVRVEQLPLRMGLSSPDIHNKTRQGRLGCEMSCYHCDDITVAFNDVITFSDVNLNLQNCSMIPAHTMHVGKTGTFMVAA